MSVFTVVTPGRAGGELAVMMVMPVVVVAGWDRLGAVMVVLVASGCGRLYPVVMVAMVMMVSRHSRRRRRVMMVMVGARSRRRGAQGDRDQGQHGRQQSLENNIHQVDSRFRGEATRAQRLFNTLGTRSGKSSLINPAPKASPQAP